MSMSRAEAVRAPTGDQGSGGGGEHGAWPVQGARCRKAIPAAASPPASQSAADHRQRHQRTRRNGLPPPAAGLPYVRPVHFASLHAADLLSALHAGAGGVGDGHPDRIDETAPAGADRARADPRHAGELVASHQGIRARQRRRPGRHRPLRPQLDVRGIQIRLSVDHHNGPGDAAGAVRNRARPTLAHRGDAGLFPRPSHNEEARHLAAAAGLAQPGEAARRC